MTSNHVHVKAKIMRVLQCGLMILVPIAWTGCGHLSKRVDEGIESVGGELTGVPVDVERVHLGLIQGRGRISGVTVANPEGYQEAFAFRLDEARLDLSVLSLLRRDPVVLEELVIDSPVIAFERKAGGGSNLKDIADSVLANQEPASEEPVQAELEAEDSPREPLRIAVRRLVIKGVGYRLRGADGTSIAGTLPTIELTDVGGKEGQAAGGIGATIVFAMTRQAFLQVAGRKLGEMLAHVDLSTDLYDAGEILETWGNALDLSSHQLAEMRPLVTRQCETFHLALADAQAQGFLDLESLSREFSRAAEDAKRELDETLTTDQKEALALWYDQLGPRTTRRIWDALATELAGFLGLDPEQTEKLHPILRDQTRKRAELLGSLVHDPMRSVDDFRTAYHALQRESRQALSEVLDPAQLAVWTERQQQVEEWICETFLPRITGY